MRRLHALVFIGASLLPSAPLFAQPPVASTPDSKPSREILELTFGSSELFFTQSIQSGPGKTVEAIVPVTSLLLMAEWLVADRVSVIAFFGLPLETQTTLRDGALSEEYVAPSIALGASLSPLRLDVFRASAFELQLAGFAGRTMGSLTEDRFYPMIAARTHFHTESGFTLYLGGAYAFAEDTRAILYGIGHRF